MTPDKERAAIVAYLRETKKIHEKNAREERTTKFRDEYLHHAHACELAAYAIEIGEHWFTNGGSPRYV